MSKMIVKKDIGNYVVHVTECERPDGPIYYVNGYGPGLLYTGIGTKDKGKAMRDYEILADEVKMGVAA